MLPRAAARSGAPPSPSCVGCTKSPLIGVEGEGEGEGRGRESGGGIIMKEIIQRLSVLIMHVYMGVT